MPASEQASPFYSKKIKENSLYPLTHELNLFIFGSFGWKTLQQNHWGGSSILVRAPACHAGGCEFKPRLSRDKALLFEKCFSFFRDNPSTGTERIAQ